jgi:uncharacterized protein (DUF342 family)
LSAPRLKLLIAKDGMSVTADVVPGAAMDLKSISATLQGAHVVFVDDPAPIQELAKKLADPAFSARGLVIARGRPAKPGRDGYFEPAFSVGIQAGHVDPSGTIDFFDRELLKPLQADEYVGTLHPPVVGVPGKRVDGAEIKVSPVRPLNMQVGPGIRHAPDNRLYAACSGVLVYENNRKIDVARHHVHMSDVDLRSGSLDMEGALTVRGSVQHQFTVRATGDIEIQGSVESGSVFGSSKVRIRGGVRGGDRGVVLVEGDVDAGYGEGASIRSGGVLKLGSAVNCELAARKVEVARIVRGGSVQAEITVQVQEAGAPHSGGRTLLAAGIPLERPICDVRLALLAHKEQRVLQHRAGVREPEGRGKAGKLGRVNLGIAQKELEIKAELAGQREQLLPDAAVHVLGKLHPGVTIQLGAHTLPIEESDTRVSFRWDPQKRAIRREGRHP